MCSVERKGKTSQGSVQRCSQGRRTLNTRYQSHDGLNNNKSASRNKKNQSDQYLR